ncbi:MAG: flagellar biosynthesis protein FliQ [Ancrocorticia sp.]|jgi:flagellar biosynthetic protein FliQ|nr:flagellar biosynthesis protein FliQ [Ancrocorticia sp.]MCI2178334.1 flagellar biosynthesis protein FliQ [Ancrocorticia sp.]MCI2193140.1 flagellar biosynthesis protein FliQ [Ancrocorticia sp.]MCI2198860.1 flagellar biosynthesis protein FliQ [Ancrocorticia sp.]
MNVDSVIDVVRIGLTLAAKLGGPVLITALVVGLLISIFQSATQIQEVTLSFVPKALAVAIVFVIAGNWMITELIDTTHQLFDMVPTLINGG